MSDDHPLIDPEPAASQPAAPSVEPPTSGPEPPREPAAPEAPAGQPEAPTGQPGPPLPANTAAPGLVFCANCRAAVEPSGRGLCPRCGRFLPDNTIAMVTGLRSKKLAKIVDQYRLDLIDQLFAERGGRDALDVVSRIAIENYALVCAQHKTIEARLDADGLFTQTGRRRSAFDMLKGISETIDRLRAELPPPITRSNEADDLGDATIDELIERTAAILRSLLETRDHHAEFSRLRCGPNDVDGGPSLDDITTVRAAGLLVQAETPTLSEGAAPTAVLAPAPEPKPASDPQCGYGCGSLERCAEVKETNYAAWIVLHGLDPEVIKEKDERATQEMMLMIGKPLPEWYRR